MSRLAKWLLYTEDGPTLDNDGKRLEFPTKREAIQAAVRRSGPCQVERNTPGNYTLRHGVINHRQVSYFLGKDKDL